MRTDTERLDYVLTIVEQQDEEAADKLGAAYTLGFRGRVMVDAAMGARIIEPGQPMPELTAIDLATAELGRIRNVKGCSEEWDDGYDGQELVWASIAYLTPGDERHDYGGAPEVWPWSEGRFKPSPDDRKKELTKGIALALCELDRLIRAERRQDEAEFDAAMDAGLPAADYAPREFKVGDRVICNDPNYTSVPKDAHGTIVLRSGADLWRVELDGRTDVLGYLEREMEHADD